jgi:hypothetical protein
MKSNALLLMALLALLYSETGISPSKIHDFLPQNTGITHSRYLFFEDISGKSYSLSFKGEKFYKNQEPVIAAQKMVVSQEKGCHDC